MAMGNLTQLSSLPVIPEPPLLGAAVMARPLQLVGPLLTFPRSKGQHIQEVTEIRPGPRGDHNLRPATGDKRFKATKAQHRAF